MTLTLARQNTMAFACGPAAIAMASQQPLNPGNTLWRAHTRSGGGAELRNERDGYANRSIRTVTVRPPTSMPLVLSTAASASA